MLEITYRSSNADQGKTSWRLSGNQLIPLSEGIPEPVRPAEQALPVPWQIDLDGIEKGYDDSSFVLRIPELQIKQVRCLGIYGENGSGKTTLADCLTGITPHSGKIHIRIPGVDPPRLGYLVQHMGTYTHGLSIGEILQKFTDQGRLRVLDAPQLESLISTAAPYQVLADQDSKLGFRMILLAALIAGDYDLVMLDEPTYGLPAGAVVDFISWTMDQLGAKPLAIISHDHNFLSLFCDRIIELENGVVHASRV
ncbi:MAG: ABC-F family ATP-binding cassette domain-containing protein [Fidelibacterota bacterium]|nr:MAG: ABC-F family ATP-binding cassette domain-containing protein [Candidatus Neomarinimicrobiota bacterium]